MNKKFDQNIENKFQDLIHYLDGFNKFRDKAEIETIYHFSDLSGLIGIFQSEKFWASNAFFLNDSSEVKYGLQVAREKFDEISKTINSDKLKNILDGFNNDFAKMILDSNYFIVSFCEKGDLLSQWRGYSSNTEGISIGFDIELLKKTVDLKVCKVIYDKNTQDDMMNNIFNVFKEMFEYLEQTKFDSFLHYFRIWISIVNTTILTFKDSSFSEEHEWRLIYNHDSLGNQNDKIYYRERKDYILPYVEIKIKNFEAHIKQIITGPTASSNSLAFESIRYFLMNHNIQDEIISKSEIPFRK